MSSIQTAASRRRSYLLASTILAPIVSLGISEAAAQQSASPNLLPKIQVEAPTDRSRPAPEPAADRPSVSRPVVRAARQAPTDAQPSAAPSQEKAVVVSPTAIETPIDQVANSVTVITARDMERDQRRTAPDALSTVPGLNVVQSGGPGGLTSVFTRGTNANHTKVLIDGIDVSDSSNPNRSFDFGQLLTSDIERIEVLRGRKAACTARMLSAV
jgi:vitamin B12 transporter